MFNSISVTGRVGTVETKMIDTSLGSMKVANVSIAYQMSKYNKETSQYDNETLWYNCDISGQKANYVEKHIKKGDMVSVVGTHSVYTTKDSKQYQQIKVFDIVKLNWDKKDTPTNDQESKIDNDLPF